TPIPTPMADPDQPTTDPVQDIIQQNVTPSKTANTTDPMQVSIVQFGDTESLVETGLIDEPVTGAGNDDMWVCNGPDCEGSSGSEEEETEEGAAASEAVAVPALPE
ncbi:MAG: hypothetical protein ABJI72_15410, partial [Parasphingorhabdus sp.]